jgi:hypothetical protein
MLTEKEIYTDLFFFYLGLICEIIAECHLHSEFALCALV